MSGRKENGLLGSFIVVELAIVILVFVLSGVLELFGAESQEPIDNNLVISTVKDIIDSDMDKIIPEDTDKAQDEKAKVTRKYYYESLDESNKKVYDQILEGLKKREEKIKVDSDNLQEITKLVGFVQNDYPEIFWNNDTWKYSSTNGVTDILIDYPYDMAETQRRQQEIEKAANEILADAPVDGSDYEKILYVYEAIINRTKYITNSPDNQNICSVLLNKESVCAGYARTTQYLLEKLGVFSIYVEGMGTPPNGQEEAHAWNIVECDGKYYNLDTTWGDPIVEDGQADILSYDYFCLNDEVFLKTHTPKKDVELPPCTSMDADYYVMSGRYLTEYNKEQILELMKKSIDEKLPDISFKFADASLYQEVKDNIVNETARDAAKYSREKYGLSSEQYQYQENVEMNIIKIIWQYQ